MTSARPRALSVKTKEKSEQPVEEAIASIKLIGNSAKFHEMIGIASHLSKFNVPYIIAGEQGTGKETIARAIHSLSSRRNKPFVYVDCDAVRPAYMETGLEQSFETARGGTLFFNEITALPTSAQVQILRRLENRQKIYSTKARQTNESVRVVASSSVDLAEAIKMGKLRQDLYYRLNATTLLVPTLRERIEDILPLAVHFLEMHLKENGSNNPKIDLSPNLEKMLRKYPWPGNISELENAIMHIILSAESLALPEHLPEGIRRHLMLYKDQLGPSEQNEQETQKQWLTLEEAGAKYVEEVLAYTNGNRYAAAKILGVDRKTVIRKIRRETQKKD